LKKYYEEQLQLRVQLFEKDKETNKKLDGYNKFQSDLDKVKEMKKKIDEKLPEAMKKNSEKEFKEFFDEISDLDIYRKDYSDDYEHYITIQSIKFLKLKDSEKEEMKKIIDEKFKEAKIKKNEEEFKNFYEFNELEEYRRDSSKALENYKSKKFPEQSSQSTENNNGLELEEDFKKYFEELEILDIYKKKYPNDFNEYYQKKIK